MKIICTILFLLLAMEILFRIWDAHSKAVHKKQKAGARLVFALLLILGLLIGVLKGSFRYMPLFLILGPSTQKNVSRMSMKWYCNILTTI